jgi:DNA-binding NarL/FixJ family response regulator
LAGFEVVAVAASFREAVYLAANRVVDIAVVDVQLDTLLTPRQVSALSEHCQVVLFSARTTEPWIRQLVEAGAAAAVDKSASLDALDATLREVHAGSSPTTKRAASETGARALLSDREYEVYRALACCQTPKEVAASLGLARSTVYCHIENVRRKLGVETLQEIVARSYAEID